MNNLLLVGRITKDLELRSNASGKYVLDIPLAINNGKDDTTFITITTFNQTAETTYKYCHKGDMIGARCMIKNNNWEKDGVKHYDYQFLVDRITYLSTKKEETKQEEVKDIPNVKSNYEDAIQIDDSDLPF